MPKYANYSAEQPIKDVLRANGGTLSYAALKTALVEAGQGDLVRDVLNLHLAGKLYGIVRAVADGKPALYLSADPLTVAPDASAPVTGTGSTSGTVATNPTGSTPNTPR